MKRDSLNSFAGIWKPQSARYSRQSMLQQTTNYAGKLPTKYWQLGLNARVHRFCAFTTDFEQTLLFNISLPLNMCCWGSAIFSWTQTPYFYHFHQWRGDRHTAWKQGTKQNSFLQLQLTPEVDPPRTLKPTSRARERSTAAVWPSLLCSAWGCTLQWPRKWKSREVPGARDRVRDNCTGLGYVWCQQQQDRGTLFFFSFIPSPPSFFFSPLSVTHTSD